MRGILESPVAGRAGRRGQTRPRGVGGARLFLRGREGVRGPARGREPGHPLAVPRAGPARASAPHWLSERGRVRPAGPSERGGLRQGGRPAPSRPLPQRSGSPAGSQAPGAVPVALGVSIRGGPRPRAEAAAEEDCVCAEGRLGSVGFWRAVRASHSGRGVRMADRPTARRPEPLASENSFLTLFPGELISVQTLSREQFFKATDGALPGEN